MNKQSNLKRHQHCPMRTNVGNCLVIGGFCTSIRKDTCDALHNKLKRKWENAFQKWSNEQLHDGMTSFGKCGYGDMCDWCEDNSYGRPCVRALNAMCRDQNIRIDYTDYDFEKIW